MDLKPKQSKPAPDYPTYQRFHLSRRAVFAGGATLLLASGCTTRGVVREPSQPEPKERPRMLGLIAPAEPAKKAKPPIQTEPTIKNAE